MEHFASISLSSDFNASGLQYDLSEKAEAIQAVWVGRDVSHCASCSPQYGAYVQ